LCIKNHAEQADNHKNEIADEQNFNKQPVNNSFALNLDNISPLTIPIQRDNTQKILDSIDKVTRQISVKQNKFEKANKLFGKSIRCT
jgi:hypothetical protein